MSTAGTDTSSSANGTVIVSGPDVIQSQDFFVKAGVLHPLVVGSIAVILLFTWLRLGSNRSIAPITTFDWLINVALGSTLAGIVNGNSLVRGLLALFTMLSFQFVTSTAGARFSERLGWLFQGTPLVVVFRGMMLRHVMKRHRIATADINAALRSAGILNISQVECAIIEPNGTISIFASKAIREANVKPETLLVIPAYKALCDKEGEIEMDEEKGDRKDRECECRRSAHEDVEKGQQGGQETNASREMDNVADQKS